MWASPVCISLGSPPVLEPGSTGLTKRGEPRFLFLEIW